LDPGRPARLDLLSCRYELVAPGRSRPHPSDYGPTCPRLPIRSAFPLFEKSVHFGTGADVVSPSNASKWPTLTGRPARRTAPRTRHPISMEHIVSDADILRAIARPGSSSVRSQLIRRSACFAARPLQLCQAATSVSLDVLAPCCRPVVRPASHRLPSAPPSRITLSGSPRACALTLRIWSTHD